MTKPLINDVKRSELANVLALHDFDNTTYDLKGWVAYVVDLFRKYGIEPTHMGIYLPSSINSKKMNTYVQEIKKLDTVDNATITGITLDATMHGSGDSCRDNISTSWLSIRDEPSSCVLVLDNAIVPFDFHIWNQITQQMADFFQPSYGYGFQRSFKKGPEWYPFGTIGGSVEWRNPESDLITCWKNSYHREKRYRSGDLRDVYPLNVLSLAHNQRMVEGKPLFDWINGDSTRGTLTKLSENLWSWWVLEEKIDAVRAALKPTGILLCAP